MTTRERVVDTRLGGRTAADEHTSVHVAEGLGIIDTALHTSRLREASIVGLGESTHGTHEFFKIKFDLIRNLAKLGFNLLAIEASNAAAPALDDYIQGRRDDLYAAIRLLNMSMWCTEEFAEIARWLRRYNSEASPHDQVRLVGIDIYDPSAAVQRMRAGLVGGDYTKLNLVLAALDRLAVGCRLGMQNAGVSVDRSTMGILRDIRRRTRGYLTDTIGERGLADLEAIEEWARSWTWSDGTKKHELNIFSRSAAMGRILIRQLRRAGIGSKAIVWAHNFHVSFQPAAEMSMGSSLKKKLADRYYAVALETSGGSYLAREYLPDRTMGGFMTEEISAPPPGSIPRILADVGKKELMLDFCAGEATLAPTCWQVTPRLMHMVGWGRNAELPIYATVTAKSAFDGLIYLRRSSPSTPVANATGKALCW